MSLGICRTCKYEAVCTYPHDRAIIQCDEHEYADMRVDRETPEAKAAPRERETVGAAKG